MFFVLLISGEFKKLKLKFFWNTPWFYKVRRLKILGGYIKETNTVIWDSARKRNCCIFLSKTSLTFTKSKPCFFLVLTIKQKKNFVYTVVIYAEIYDHPIIFKLYLKQFSTKPRREKLIKSLFLGVYHLL